MAIRKNSSEQPDRLTPQGAPSIEERVNDEENLDTRDVAHDIEEGDEDYDDENLEDDLEEEEDLEEDLEDEDETE